MDTARLEGEGVAADFRGTTSAVSSEPGGRRILPPLTPCVNMEGAVHLQTTFRCNLGPRWAFHLQAGPPRPPLPPPLLVLWQKAGPCTVFANVLAAGASCTIMELPIARGVIAHGDNRAPPPTTPGSPWRTVGICVLRQSPGP